MFRTTMTALALAAAAALPAGAQQAGAAAKPTAAPANAATASTSSERLARIRQALQNQIAVHDAGEGAMRAPTADEAAALSSAPTAATRRTEQSVALPGGGVALRADASSLSFLVVETRPDGKLAFRHGHADTAKAVKAQPTQGGAHAR